MHEHAPTPLAGSGDERRLMAGAPLLFRVPLLEHACCIVY
jgi:hypothetical protein